jgi:hypothetical protein
LGTCWEHIGNKGKEKKQKKKTPPGKQGPSGVDAEPLGWLHEIALSKTVGHHF